MEASSRKPGKCVPELANLPGLSIIKDLSEVSGALRHDLGREAGGVNEQQKNLSLLPINVYC
jgi:hypothetical protein